MPTRAIGRSCRGATQAVLGRRVAETNIERRRRIRTEADLRRFEIDDDEKAA
jgi:hypothetical protein